MENVKKLNHIMCFIFRCSSFVGRTSMDKQIVTLTNSPIWVEHCITKGQTIHEFLHALGFEHEHNRSDRDKYIRYFEENASYSSSTVFTINLIIYR